MKSKLKMYIKTWSDKDKFGNSEYPENSPFFDKSNKKTVRKFKDEVSGIPINEFIGLRSKMYSYLKGTDECGKKVKGIKKNVIKMVCFALFCCIRYNIGSNSST